MLITGAMLAYLTVLLMESSTKNTDVNALYHWAASTLALGLISIICFGVSCALVLLGLSVTFTQVFSVFLLLAVVKFLLGKTDVA